MPYTKPVKVGDELEVEITDLGVKGDGIAKIGETNFAIIVKNAEIDKKYKIRIHRMYDKFAIGKVIE